MANKQNCYKDALPKDSNEKGDFIKSTYRKVSKSWANVEEKYF
jgi:hypothetical protein